MKQKPSQSDPIPLWQLAEQKAHGELEPTGPELLPEFNILSDLISKHPKAIEHREMNGDLVEITPSARYISLAKSTETGTNPTEQNSKTFSVTLLDDNADIPGSQVAQAHRIEGSAELYLTLASRDKKTFRQYTVHDGLVTDVADSSKELSEAEITNVKAAFEAMSEKIVVNHEAIDRQRISRKIGAWWTDSDGRRAQLRASRRLRRELRWQSLGEVGTDL